MAKKARSEEQILRALHQAESGERVADIRREAWGQRGHVLRLEKEVQRSGAERAARVAAVARGERQAQAPGGGPVAGPAHAAGDRAKKAVRPRQRRELGQWLQAVFTASSRRVSGLMMINRSTMN
jgi:hypothetical protein